MPAAGEGEAPRGRVSPGRNGGFQFSKPLLDSADMADQYWLVKQEPEAYSWTTFQKEGRTAWTGVRNFQARNHLRAMRRGDLVLFYHSVSEKRVVGVARVDRTAYADPTADEGDWSSVDLVPVTPLRAQVALEAIKGDAILKEMPLVRQTRLSVTPLTSRQFTRVLELGETRIAR